MSSAVGPRAFQDAFKPYENLSIIRLGQFDEAEMAFLAQGSNAAIAWSHTQAVQIILDRKGAMATVKYDQAASVYTAEMEGCGRLRLVQDRLDRRRPSRARRWPSPSASTTAATSRSATW